MAKTIWKYELTPGVCTVEMPAGAEVLTVAFQREALQMWALVDSDNTEREQRVFCSYATGEAAGEEGDALQYIGTALLSGYGFVFHVFEVRAER